ncbi:MAG: helix-hairpin-helix domain-containing protein [bacterium]
MRTILVIFFIILALFSSTYAFTSTNLNGQEINSEEDIYRFYHEGLIEYFDYLRLLDIFENKIDINQAGIEDLLDLPGIDIKTAERIIEYREKSGDFSKIFDLQKVPLLSKDVYKNIRNFVDIFPLKEGGLVRVKLEEDPLDDEGLYVYHRLRYQTPWFGFGYILERDEEVDNYSIENGNPKKQDEEIKFRLKKKYVLLKDFFGIKNITAGDYTLRFGKGLVIGNSYSRNRIGILPDLSLYDKFFGTALELKINCVTLTPFYSKNKLNNNGFPDVYQEEIKGLNTIFDVTKYFNLGGTYYKSGIKKDFDFNLNGYPDGNEAEVSGMDFSYRYGSFRFSGETAKVKGKGGGKYMELYYDLKKVFSLISFRDYAPDFYNPHSQSFSQEDDEPDDRDERGFYFESNFKFRRDFTIRTSFDQWSHPGRKITDRELTGQISYYPVSFLRLWLKRRIRGEDLYGQEDKGIKDYIDGRFYIWRKFELDVFYGQNENKEFGSENIVDNFWGTEVKLESDKNIFLIRAKFNDDNITIAGDKKREYYFYAKLREIKQVTLSFSFRAVHSSEDIFPNPEEIYRIVFDCVW